MSQPEDLKNTFSVEVVDYAVQGDVDYYNNHVFILNVWIGQQMFKISRTYLAFCELDARFRRQYARSNLPVLNLAGAGKKANIKVSNTAKANPKGIPDTRASILFTDVDMKPDKKDLVKKVDNNEIIAYKKTPLQTYLNELFKIPEILQSDTLLFFFDEESVSGEIVPDLSEDIQDKLEVSLLIGDDPTTAKTVRRDHKVEFDMDSDEVVVWSFSTKHHDIGFSVLFNDAEVVTYQRYLSHERIVLGSFEAPNKSGRLTLAWDNTYSKFRAKQLNYVTKTVGKMEFETTVSSAAEIRREKHRMTKQRQLLKRILTSMSGELLSSTAAGRAKRAAAAAASDINHSIYDEHGEVITGPVGSFASTGSQGDDSSGGVVVVGQLKNEKKFLQQALSESESALVAERTAAADLQQRFEDTMTANTTLIEELSTLRSELEYLRQEQWEREQSGLRALKEEEAQLRPLSLEAILRLPADQLDRVNVFPYFEAVRSAHLSLAAKAAADAVALESLQEAVAKLKTERKQLKAYGIQSKTSIEELTKAAEESRHNNILLSYENQLLKQKMGSLELEVQQLHSAASLVAVPASSSSSSKYGSAFTAEELAPALPTIPPSSGRNLVHLFQGDNSDDEGSINGNSEAFATASGSLGPSSANSSESNLVKIDLSSPPPDELHDLVSTMGATIMSDMRGMWNSVVNSGSSGNISDSGGAAGGGGGGDYSDIYSRRGSSTTSSKPRMTFGF